MSESGSWICDDCTLNFLSSYVQKSTSHCCIHSNMNNGCVSFLRLCIEFNFEFNYALSFQRQKILSEEEKLNVGVAAAAKKKAESYTEAQNRKIQKRTKEIAASKAGQKNQGAGDETQSEFTNMDIRVGKVVKVWNHPKAEKLFCEQIDLAEKSGPREIASGLRDHYVLDGLQNKLVLIVCNIKVTRMVGFSSHGMVLVAKSIDGSKVELIHPPDGSIVGERVFIDGLSGKPFTPAQVKKKKAFEIVAKDLKTGKRGVATWKGMAIKTSAGECAAMSLVGVPIL